MIQLLFIYWDLILWNVELGIEWVVYMIATLVADWYGVDCLGLVLTVELNL